MIKINDKHSFAIDEVLFSFALASEAADVFEGYQKVITGIGKVNAAYELMKAIQHKRPSIIVNLGSAGSNYLPFEKVSLPSNQSVTSNRTGRETCGRNACGN